MRDVVLDAMSFRCLRELDLLEPCIRAIAGRTNVRLTEYVARHELNLVDGSVRSLESAELLRVDRVLRSSPAGKRYREFQRIGWDRGESEGFAMILDEPASTRPVFVTTDKNATANARDLGIPVADLFGLLLVAVSDAGLDVGLVENALAYWDDPHASRCRPKTWQGFAIDLGIRLESERVRFGVTTADR